VKKVIKVASIGYQKDAAQATVEYDLAGETYSFTVAAKLSLLVGMTVEEVRAYIVSRVEAERARRLRELVEGMLDGLVGVDLEAKG